MVLFFLKVCLVSTLAGFACFRLTKFLETVIGWQRFAGALLVLTAVTSVGVVLTGILAKLFRIRELDSYLKKLWSLVPARGV